MINRYQWSKYFWQVRIKVQKAPLLPTILTWDRRESTTEISKLALPEEQIENFNGVTLKLHWVDSQEAQGHVLFD